MGSTGCTDWDAQQAVHGTENDRNAREVEVEEDTKHGASRERKDCAVAEVGSTGCEAAGDDRMEKAGGHMEVDGHTVAVGSHRIITDEVTCPFDPPWHLNSSPYRLQHLRQALPWKLLHLRQDLQL